MKPFVETNLEELSEQVDAAERAWKAAVVLAQSPTMTARERIERDIEAERRWKAYWPLRRQYIDAVKDCAAEQEQYDPEGIQNHPEGPELIRP